MKQRKRWEKGDFTKTKKQIREEEAQRLIEEENEEDSDSDVEKPTDSIGLKLIRQLKKPNEVKRIDALNDLNEGYVKNLVDVSVQDFYCFFLLFYSMSLTPTLSLLLLTALLLV